MKDRTARKLVNIISANGSYDGPVYASEIIECLNKKISIAGLEKILDEIEDIQCVGWDYRKGKAYRYIGKTTYEEEFNEPEEETSCEGEIRVDFWNSKNYSEATPARIKLYGENIVVREWSSLYCAVVEAIFKRYAKDFYYFGDDCPIKLSEGTIVVNRFQKPKPLYDFLYLETDETPNTIVNNIAWLLDHFEIDEKKCIIWVMEH